MLGPKQEAQGALFYEFSMEDHVPHPRHHENTGLASEVEPLAHAFATMFQRRATVLEETADRLKDKIAALIRSQDGSEIAEVELETAQRQFEVAYEKADALKLMAEAAAEAYERETGGAYVSVTGSRTTPRAMETGAVFEAKRLLEAADRAEAERNKVEGTFIAVAGSSDWADHARIFARLDAARERCPDRAARQGACVSCRPRTRPSSRMEPAVSCSVIRQSIFHDIVRTVNSDCAWIDPSP